MSAPNSLQNKTERRDQPPSLKRLALIDRLAIEMRARSAGELPHSFYVEQVKRQIAGRSIQISSANHESAPEIVQQPSVFHAWALSE